jgi:hypothetical protein
MHTSAELARTLNRPAIQVRNLQTRFGLPILQGAAYPDAYLAFLRTIVRLRMLDVSEASLLRIWQLEKKLLTLLHVDSTGSPTWFIDSCGQTSHRKRRLLLTNYDLGIDISSKMLQPGLNFAAALPELFAGREMGEDAIRVLEKYLKLFADLRQQLAAELPHVRAAAAWARRL